MFEKEKDFIKRKSGYDKAIKAFILGMGKFPLKEPIDTEVEIIKNSMKEVKGEKNKGEIEALLMFLATKKTYPYETTKQITARFRGNDTTVKLIPPAIEIANKIDDLIETFLTPLCDGDDGKEKYIKELKKIIARGGDSMKSINKASKVNTNSFFNSKNKKIESLIKEALELIALFNNSSTSHVKFSENHVERLASLYEDLDNTLTKRFIKKNISDSVNIINILKQIIQILKNRDLEIDTKSLKALKAKESYILKMQGEKAGSPFEIYHSARNKAVSIMDKGLKDSDSMLSLSMLLEEMKNAYEEDNDTGGSQKLHIAECHQDFNSIEAYLNDKGDKKSVTVSDRIEELKQSINNSLPKENKEVETLLSPIGTNEREGEEELINLAKEVNSSKKVAFSIKLMRLLGRVGLIVSLFVLIFGVSFDLEFHLPKLHPLLGDFWFYVLAGFITVLIASLLHIPLESWVNRKWKPEARKYVIMALVFSLPAIIYIDYRAVQNYSKQIANINIEKDLNNTNSSLGLLATTNKEDIKNRESEIEEFKKDITRLKARNNNLLTYCDNLQVKIDRIDSKKRRTRRDNTNRWRLNRKIKKYKTEIRANKIEIKSLEDKVNKTKKYIKDNQANLLTVAKEADDLKEEEARNRAIMMYVLIALIDASSMLKIFADFINNKNLPVSIDDIYKLNNMMDAGAIFRNYSSQLIASQGVNMKNSLQLDNFAHQAMFANTLEQKANNLQNIALLGEVSRETDRKTTEILLSLTRPNNITR